MPKPSSNPVREILKVLYFEVKLLGFQIFGAFDHWTCALLVCGRVYDWWRVC
jgi:hypothetical protein